MYTVVKGSKEIGSYGHLSMAVARKVAIYRARLTHTAILDSDGYVIGTREMFESNPRAMSLFTKLITHEASVLTEWSNNLKREEKRMQSKSK
jgi:hypothetical protein